MSSEAEPIKVVLVDDHPMVRQGLQAFLTQNGVDVVATAGDGREILDWLSAGQADVMVVDLTLEEGSGLDVLRTVRKLYPLVGMVVYSVHEDGDKVRQAMQAGAFGYVTKREDPDLLLVALHHARRGERYLSPRGARAMAESVAGGPGLDPRELLSPQELEVFVLTGRGHAIPDIADRMNLSVRTVETYLGRIIEKLGMGGRRELRLFASEWLRKEPL